MANRITIQTPVPSTVPANGYIIGYRVLGTTGTYNISTHPTLPATIDTADSVGTLYEGYVTRDCGLGSQSTQFFWQTPCGCTGSGYVVAASGVQCQKNDNVAPTVTNSGYCLAASTNNVYILFGARIYNVGFTNDDLLANFGTTSAGINQEVPTNGQWKNNVGDALTGPMNREGVWIDSNCDGSKDALASGGNTTIAYVYNNPGTTNKTIYVGLGADNQFKLVVNGTQLCDTSAGTGGGTSDKQFKVWHLIPIVVVPGQNYINAIATGDGSVNDAIAMVIYDNTVAQLVASTSDTSLTIPFHTGSLRGGSYDVSTCPAGYSLDSSAGAGSYTCVRTVYKSCNTLA